MKAAAYVYMHIKAKLYQRDRMRLRFGKSALQITSDAVRTKSHALISAEYSLIQEATISAYTC